MKTYHLEFEMQELQTIATALHDLPYKQVASLLQKIDLQMAPQLIPATPEPTE
jgi:hypothetical protein